MINLNTIIGRQKFYQSKEWRNLRAYKLSIHPYCEVCKEKNNKYNVGVDIHHKIDIATLPTIENALNLDGLQTLCKKHHSEITYKSTIAVNNTPTRVLNTLWKDDNF